MKRRYFYVQLSKVKWLAREIYFIQADGDVHLKHAAVTQYVVHFKGKNITLELTYNYIITQ